MVWKTSHLLQTLTCVALRRRRGLGKTMVWSKPSPLDQVGVSPTAEYGRWTRAETLKDDGLVQTLTSWASGI